MLGWENQTFQYTYIGNYKFQSPKQREELKNTKYQTQIIDNKIIEYKFGSDAINLGDLLMLNQCGYVKITKKQSLQIIMMILKYYQKIRDLGLVHGQLQPSYIWIEVKGGSKFSYLSNPDIQFGSICFVRYQFKETTSDLEAIQKTILQFDPIFLSNGQEQQQQKENKIYENLQNITHQDQASVINLLQSNIEQLEREVKQGKIVQEKIISKSIDIRTELQKIVSEKLKQLTKQDDQKYGNLEYVVSFKSKYLFLKVAPQISNLIECNIGSKTQTIKQLENYFDNSNQVKQFIQEQRGIVSGIFYNQQIQNEQRYIEEHLKKYVNLTFDDNAWRRYKTYQDYFNFAYFGCEGNQEQLHILQTFRNEIFESQQQQFLNLIDQLF